MGGMTAGGGEQAGGFSYPSPPEILPYSVAASMYRRAADGPEREALADRMLEDQRAANEYVATAEGLLQDAAEQVDMARANDAWQREELERRQNRILELEREAAAMAADAAAAKSRAVAAEARAAEARMARERSLVDKEHIEEVFNDFVDYVGASEVGVFPSGVAVVLVTREGDATPHLVVHVSKDAGGRIRKIVLEDPRDAALHGELFVTRGLVRAALLRRRGEPAGGA
jgi:hypothetical protein